MKARQKISPQLRRRKRNLRRIVTGIGQVWLSDHLVKKIRVASNNGRDKKALEVIKKIFNEE